MLIISITIGLLLSSAGNQSGACDDFPFKQLLKAPPRSRYEYRGQYVNLSYEYSVKIPKGLTAYDGRNEANHSGFGLAFGEAPRGYIFVRGEHNSLEYDTPRQAAIQDVEFLRQDGNEIKSETITEAHLGTLDAALLVVNYTCPGSADRRVKSSIMALSPKNGFLYTLELYSHANRYESDRAALDEIVKSWEMTSRPRRQR